MGEELYAPLCPLCEKEMVYFGDEPVEEDGIEVPYELWVCQPCQRRTGNYQRHLYRKGIYKGR